ncbi:hypothetical protein GHB46_15330, partial [Enterococcus faecium]|nr:hypothetical protein [Enterococcus faecium]MCZ1795019.1 hypothetical protein [Enterococcus faecium]MCZ1797979.1 hypothetical protein [Enterococcus faecium]
TVTLIPNGIHHPPIEDGRLLPNSVKKDNNWIYILVASLFLLFILLCILLFVLRKKEEKEK